MAHTITLGKGVGSWKTRLAGESCTCRRIWQQDAAGGATVHEPADRKRAIIYGII
jgi:hypothetical protein